MIAAMASETSTAPLRSFQHKDVEGNLICTLSTGRRRLCALALLPR